jgi:SAM-dependent methyltransferase
MTEIEHRVESSAVVSPKYSEYEFTAEEVAAGKHRAFIGGHWETHGLHQVEFLTAHGLRPEHTFLDVGCGAFRAGRHLVDLLDAGNYYGVDANRSLIESGYDAELTDAQRAKLPTANLRANDRFDVDFGVRFDMAIAQSVFTHVSLNHVRLCLYRVAKVMRPGGKFYVTFNEEPTSTPLDAIVRRRKGGRVYLTEQNIFWYYRDDLRWAASFSPWRFRYLGEWGYPGKQQMVELTRLPGSGRPAPAADSELAASVRAALAPRAQQAKRLTARGRRWAARRLDPG